MFLFYLLHHVQLFCNSMDCSPPGFSMGFPKQEYWSGLPFPPPGDLPNPGIKPACPALAGRFSTLSRQESLNVVLGGPVNSSCSHQLPVGLRLFPPDCIVSVPPGLRNWSGSPCPAQCRQEWWVWHLGTVTSPWLHTHSPSQSSHCASPGCLSCSWGRRVV